MVRHSHIAKDAKKVLVPVANGRTSLSMVNVMQRQVHCSLVPVPNHNTTCYCAGSEEMEAVIIVDVLRRAGRCAATRDCQWNVLRSDLHQEQICGLLYLICRC
jgi:hypothetical protein